MMNEKNREEYQIEDFLVDESFVNYHFGLNTVHQEFWQEWIRQHPAKRSLVNEAKEMLQMLSLTPLDNEHRDELARIKGAILDENLSTVTKRAVLFRLLHWNQLDKGHKQQKWVKYLAAAAILIFLISGYLLLQRFNVKSNGLSERANNGSTPLVLTMIDGTIVTLAPHSFLRYPQQFGKDREVYLGGEGQFHVSRDVNHPFRLHAEDMIVTVLGTVFNVKKQSGDSIVLVELLEGKLSIEIKNNPATKPLTLNPNERVVYNQYSKNLYKESWQRYSEPTLKENHLVFRQNSFEEIARQIKSVFGVTLINQSNKRNWRFTGEFNNTTAKEIIESICLVKGLNSQGAGDTILIR